MLDSDRGVSRDDLRMFKLATGNEPAGLGEAMSYVFMNTGGGRSAQFGIASILISTLERSGSCRARMLGMAAGFACLSIGLATGRRDYDEQIASIRKEFSTNKSLD